MTKETMGLWAKRIAGVLVSYGALCALPFVIAPLVGAASAAQLGYGPIYETAAAILSIIGVAIWDIRRRKRRNATRR
jgi:cytochrome c biogenesis protein CcdA